MKYAFISAVKLAVHLLKLKLVFSYGVNLGFSYGVKLTFSNGVK